MQFSRGGVVELIFGTRQLDLSTEMCVAGETGHPLSQNLQAEIAGKEDKSWVIPEATSSNTRSATVQRLIG